LKRRKGKGRQAVLFGKRLPGAPCCRSPWGLPPGRSPRMLADQPETGWLIGFPAVLIAMHLGFSSFFPLFSTERVPWDT